MLAIVAGRVRWLHFSTREEGIDCRQAARHRMSPRRTLHLRETHGRQQENLAVHAKLGEDQHIELIVADPICGLEQRAVHMVIASCVRFDGPGNLVLDVAEVIDVDVELALVECAGPGAEITSHGGPPEEEARESDPRFSAAPWPVEGPLILWCRAFENVTYDSAVTYLQAQVVFALVGQVKVHPFGGGQQFGWRSSQQGRQFCLETFQRARITSTARDDIVF